MHITIMGPLHNTKFDNNFINQLKQLKDSGVASISTDLWWDHVEYNKSSYDWRNANLWLKSLKKVGLKWTPILCFHTCGHNVNDTFNVELPKYIQNEYMQDPFKNSKGDEIHEYVSYWNDSIYERYKRVMQSFCNEFRNDFDHIEKVYISTGPAGELRYPSYNPKTGWKYSHPGCLTCYSDGAKNDFRKYLINKYLTLDQLNIEWDSHYMKFEEIEPPLCNETFFLQYQYTSKYGRDVLDWYEKVLHNHFNKISTLANSVFRSTNVRLGAKLSGVHWKYHIGRLAEKATGYVDETYLKLIKLFNQKNFELTITCLEMNNNDESGIDNIIHTIYTVANAFNINIYGENALPLYNDHYKGWKNLENKLKKYNFKGFTLLRWDNIFNYECENILKKIKLINEI